MGSTFTDDRGLDKLVSGIGGDALAPAMPLLQPRMPEASGETVVGAPTNPTPPKPKKKRVRKQKMELDYLRVLVVKLEEQMTELKARQVEGEKQPKGEPPTEGSCIWKGIAERQMKERERAEQKNQKLRVSLEGQLRLANKLEKILRKRPRDDGLELMAGIKRVKPALDTAVTPTDDEIFADQYAHVMRAHLEVDQLFSGPEFADQTNTFCDMHVMNDPSSDTGVAFVTKASALLPFDVHVAVRAFWRTFAEGCSKNLSYFHEERVSTENLVSSSYGLYFDAGAFHTNVRGKKTYRKLIDGNRVILMWKSIAEPVEINDTKFVGLKCVQTGWIVLRGVSLADTDVLIKSEHGCSVDTPLVSTALQSYSKMTMELEDDIADQELQVGALSDFVVNSHDTITEVCGKMINEVLVEEDWNLNGWLSNISI